MLKGHPSTKAGLFSLVCPFNKSLLSAQQLQNLAQKEVSSGEGHSQKFVLGGTK